MTAHQVLPLKPDEGQMCQGRAAPAADAAVFGIRPGFVFYLFLRLLLLGPPFWSSDMIGALDVGSVRS